MSGAASLPRWFPNGGIASPHHLATAAGQAVLAGGGNAVDAAIAANLVLAVVTPYHCGVGGDLLAIVWDGAPTGVVSVGAAPSGAEPGAVARAAAGSPGQAHTFPGTGGMPALGPLTVTVPGAAAGWQHLLDRWGTRTFAEAARTAIGLAREGFPVSAFAAAHVDRARPGLAAQHGWDAVYGRMRAGERFVQPRLAATLETLARDGPDALYRGALGERVVELLQRLGSTMTTDDLARHRVEEAEPLRGRFRDAEVLELPPPTQGVTALTALGVLDALGPPPQDPGTAEHLRIEAMRAALADREQYLADPLAMRCKAEELVRADRLAAMAAAVDPDRRAAWPPGRPVAGGTAYICAGDRDGLLVSLIQSNFAGFGSGVVVTDLGVALHNRGAHFSLDPGSARAIGPGLRPPHTLIPAMALRDGAPWLVFGTMGGDSQAQVHLQLLAGMLDTGLDVQAAIDAPRWAVDVADGDVLVEPGVAASTRDALRRRGHVLRAMSPGGHEAGHCHALEVTAAGYAAGTDPRCEGAAAGH